MRPTTSRLIAIAATLAVAGCGAASNSPSPGPVTATGIDAAGHTAATPVTPAQLAERLIRESIAPAGTVRSLHSPTALLRNPPSRPAGHGVIIRYRWWRIAMPWHAAYSWVAHHQDQSLTSESGGAIGGPALRDNEKYADFAPGHVPTSINSATLTLAVQPLTAHTSAIGAYSVVVRQPPRPAAENVPLTLRKVSLVGRKTAMPGGKTVVTRRTVTGRTARRLVRDFDHLVVRPAEGPLPCPVALSSETATFRADGQVWVVTNGVCDAVTVRLNGHQEPALEATDRFTTDLDAALGSGASDPFAASNPA
jgi:hypothetical protein